MNCTQARAMLAAYRELKNDKVDTTELDMHLEECASCRQILANNTFVNTQLHSLTSLAPPVDMHAKLMRTLASEHLQLIQQSEPGTVPTPLFLQPYLQELAHSSFLADPVAAFSTADTGPLPIIRTAHKKRQRFHMSQFAVIGIAAMFLMVLMMGGLTSLLLVAHGDPQKAVISLNQPSNVDEASYTTDTPYQHVISAVGDRNDIYYTSYDNSNNDAWVLERLDRTTQISTSLLETVSTSPLIVLRSSENWLIWLQLDNPPPTPTPDVNISHHRIQPQVRHWNLEYLSLAQQNSNTTQLFDKPMTLAAGTFQQDSIPNWVYTPVQGIWFIQNTVLVAMLDNNGASHLYSYQLSETGKSVRTEIARADTNHILTSPTANSDGSQIFWSEEWRSGNGQLFSNIWTQQVLDAPLPSHGYILEHSMIVKQLLRSDGASFHPQVVNNTLFLLSTVDLANSTRSNFAGAAATPTAAPANTPATSRFDTRAVVPPLDETVHGTLLALSLSGNSATLPNAVNTTDNASSLQVGTDFVLWQSDKGYEMYDVRTDNYINVGDVLSGAHFVAVNADATVWVTDNTMDNSGSTVNFKAFNWPEATK